MQVQAAQIRQPLWRVGKWWVARVGKPDNGWPVRQFEPDSCVEMVIQATIYDAGQASTRLVRLQKWSSGRLGKTSSWLNQGPARRSCPKQKQLSPVHGTIQVEQVDNVLDTSVIETTEH